MTVNVRKVNQMRKHDGQSPMPRDLLLPNFFSFPMLDTLGVAALLQWAKYRVGRHVAGEQGRSQGSCRRVSPGRSRLASLSGRQHQPRLSGLRWPTLPRASYWDLVSVIAQGWSIRMIRCRQQQGACDDRSSNRFHGHSGRAAP
jgi:hypothetical protein